MNILLTVQYDGGAYAGWQRQPAAQGTSVQQVIEDALSAIIGEKTVIYGAGRTDAGVHAWGQCCNFRCSKPIPLQKLPFIVNNKLPRDIRVSAAQAVPEGFHAQFSARGKHYRYVIERLALPSAFVGRYSWRLERELDAGAMRQGAAYLLGEHDFRNFTLSRSSAKTTARNITKLEINEPLEEQFVHPWQEMTRPLVIDICGSGFLYKMVRLIVGRLAAVGSGAITPQVIGAYLDGSRREPIAPAPAQGLMLMQVFY